jgi:hypothetical protein
MAGHMLGMLEMAASSRTSASNASRCARAAIHRTLTALQVSERQTWTPNEIVDRYGDAGARASRVVVGRRHSRGWRLPGTQRVNGADEPWTITSHRHDLDLRPWMHRIDISRAIGRPLDLTGTGDGVIVADVVAEWSDRHGKDFTLTLDGSRRHLDGRGERACSVLRGDQILPQPVRATRRYQPRRPLRTGVPY